jgi:catechol-2,3-dioxygenase
MPKIKHLGHVVLYVTDPTASAKWYNDVLGMETVTFNKQIPAAFLSFGERDHDIALFQAPPGRALGHKDVEHVSTEIDGGLADLKEFYASLLRKKVEVLGVMDHGISYGVYFLDPDGHHLEVFYQHEPDGASKKKFAEIGAVAKPIDLDAIS